MSNPLTRQLFKFFAVGWVEHKPPEIPAMPRATRPRSRQTAEPDIAEHQLEPGAVCQPGRCAGPLVLPLAILALPFLDLTLAFIRRTYAGRWWFLPDKQHLHHRLLRAGLSHRRTVLLIYAFTQWLAALALVVANAEMRFLWLALATAILIGVVVVARRQIQSETAQRSLP